MTLLYFIALQGQEDVAVAASNHSKVAIAAAAAKATVRALQASARIPVPPILAHKSQSNNC